MTATDKANSSRKATAEVNITLDNLNEAPYFDRESRDRASAETARVDADLRDIICNKVRRI